MMSRLDRLIKELPNGGGVCHLESVCNISKGVQFNKSNMQDKGTYPVINGGINLSGYIDQFNQNENTITISQGGASAGYVNWLTVKFWAGAHCYILKPSECILNRYLFTFENREYKLQDANMEQESALANHLASYSSHSPLPVQCEIVRILDISQSLQQSFSRAYSRAYSEKKKLVFRDEF